MRKRRFDYKNVIHPHTVKLCTLLRTQVYPMKGGRGKGGDGMEKEQVQRNVLVNRHEEALEQCARQFVHALPVAHEQ